MLVCISSTLWVIFTYVFYTNLLVIDWFWHHIFGIPILIFAFMFNFTLVLTIQLSASKSIVSCFCYLIYTVLQHY